MRDKKEVSSRGVGLGTFLFIVFLILKLTNTIDWSWWWVTSPLWIPLVVVFGFLGIFLLFWFIGLITSIISR